MICVVATADEDQELVEFLNSVFEAFNQDKPEKFCVSWLTTDDYEAVNYYKCEYGELRRLADAINDEATIRMIAANQDRIAYFSDEFDGDTE